MTGTAGEEYEVALTRFDSRPCIWIGEENDWGKTFDLNGSFACGVKVSAIGWCWNGSLVGVCGLLTLVGIEIVEEL